MTNQEKRFLQRVRLRLREGDASMLQSTQAKLFLNFTYMRDPKQHSKDLDT
jgi:hypothetical protein